MRATEYAGAGPTAVAIDLRCRALRDLAEGRFERWVCPTVPFPAVRIRALVHQGRHDQARDDLAGHTIEDMRSWSSLDLVSAAFAASRIGPRERCHDLVSVAAERAHRDPDGAPFGTTAFVRALCHMALGQDAGAQTAFDEALVEAETADPVAGAQVRAELGRFHLGLGAARARSARAHLMAAAVCLRANHMSHLADRATAMLEGDGPVGVAGPQRAILRPGSTWLVGFGLTVAIEVDPRPGLDTLRAVVAAGGVPIALSVGDRADLHQLVGELSDIQPALGDHLRTAVTFGPAVTYEPAEPIRWGLERRSTGEQSPD